MVVEYHRVFKKQIIKNTQTSDLKLAERILAAYFPV